jgi:hypothetical protein
MALTLGMSFTRGAQSCDTWVCVSLGGGTAPVLMNQRTGESVTVDPGAIALTPAVGVFSQIGGPAVAPLFGVGAICKVVNAAFPSQRVSSLSFVVVSPSQSQGINIYEGYLIDSSQPTSTNHLSQTPGIAFCAFFEPQLAPGP